MRKRTQPEDFSALLVLLVLVACEALWFGPILTKVGFYLDDWRTWEQLFFSPQNWSSLCQAILSDERYLPRPLQAIACVTVWHTFGLKPLGHHILNCLLEILSAWLLYLSMARLTRLRSLSFLAALILLIFPAHDCTHYWATCNTITLSLVLYLLSLFLTITGMQQRSSLQLLGGSVAFFITMLNYEAFTPLCLVNLLCAIYIARPRVSCHWGRTLLRCLVLWLPYPLSMAAALFYQKLVIHGSGIQHAITLNPPQILGVFEHGWNCSLSPAAITFFLQQAAIGTANTCGMPKVLGFLLLAALLTIAATTAIVLAKRDRGTDTVWLFPALGVVAFFLSYSIYGLSDEYVPLLNSILNRTNYGGSVAAALFLAGLVGLACSFNTRRINAAAAACICLPLVSLFTLADWGMASPWMLSWTFQRQVLNLLRSHAGELSAGDTVLLANAPRYLIWSPVFDGVWDFEAAARITLRNPELHANVVSERMVLSHNEIKDISRGTLCGAYPFHRLYVLTAVPPNWYRIDTPEQFISLIQDHGMSFGLDPAIIDRWKSQAVKIER